MTYDAYIGIDPSFSRSGVAYLRDGILSVNRVQTSFGGPGFPGTMESVDACLEDMLRKLRTLRDANRISLSIEFPAPAGSRQRQGKKAKLFNAAPLFALASSFVRELPLHLPICEVVLIPTAKCRKLAAPVRTGDRGKTEMKDYTLSLLPRIRGVRKHYFLGTSRGTLCHDEAVAVLLLLYTARRDHAWVFDDEEERPARDPELKRWSFTGEQCRYPRGRAPQEGRPRAQEDLEEDHQEEDHP